MSFERITILMGDITELDCDAIVNAANTELWMGSGVAGAILNKGGRTIEDEAVKQGPIELGGAVITHGGTLRAAYVIHAAAMHPGGNASVDSIRKASLNTLEIASGKLISAIAFPALGTGVGGLSFLHCARAMLSEAIRFLETHEYPKHVYFVLFNADAMKAFKETFESLKSNNAV